VSFERASNGQGARRFEDAPRIPDLWPWSHSKRWHRRELIVSTSLCFVFVARFFGIAISHVPH
jgi:hypothetical protein